MCQPVLIVMAFITFRIQPQPLSVIARHTCAPSAIPMKHSCTSMDYPLEVLNTYVADFHGTTVVLFDKTFPDQPTNKPVCTDCHGFHDVARSG